VETQSGVDIALECDLAFESGRSAARHLPEIEVAIYRIAQEALTNVVKHAGAERVEVRIADPDSDEGHVLIEVTDDGRGFDPGDADRGFGLLGMRERVTLVRGELELQSRPGKGTTVTARIPVARRAGGDRASVSPMR
jgi:signal transduction histidine kinase